MREQWSNRTLDLHRERAARHCRARQCVLANCDQKFVKVGVCVEQRDISDVRVEGDFIDSCVELDFGAEKRSELGDGAITRMGELRSGRSELVVPCQMPAQSGQNSQAELDLMP